MRPASSPAETPRRAPVPSVLCLVFSERPAGVRAQQRRRRPASPPPAPSSSSHATRSPPRRAVAAVLSAAVQILLADACGSADPARTQGFGRSPALACNGAVEGISPSQWQLRAALAPVAASGTAPGGTSRPGWPSQPSAPTDSAWGQRRRWSDRPPQRPTVRAAPPPWFKRPVAVARPAQQPPPPSLADRRPLSFHLRAPSLGLAAKNTGLLLRVDAIALTLDRASVQRIEVPAERLRPSTPPLVGPSSAGAVAADATRWFPPLLPPPRSCRLPLAKEAGGTTS